MIRLPPRRIDPDVEPVGGYAIAKRQEQRLQVQLGNRDNGHVLAVRWVGHVELASRLGREAERHARGGKRERLDRELAKCLLAQQD